MIFVEQKIHTYASYVNQLDTTVGHVQTNLRNENSNIIIVQPCIYHTLNFVNG